MWSILECAMHLVFFELWFWCLFRRIINNKFLRFNYEKCTRHAVKWLHSILSTELFQIRVRMNNENVFTVNEICVKCVHIHPVLTALLSKTFPNHLHFGFSIKSAWNLRPPDLIIMKFNAIAMSSLSFSLVLILYPEWITYSI